MSINESLPKLHDIEYHCFGEKVNIELVAMLKSDLIQRLNLILCDEERQVLIGLENFIEEIDNI